MSCWHQHCGTWLSGLSITEQITKKLENWHDCFSFVYNLFYGHNHYRLQVLSCSSFGLRYLTHPILGKCLFLYQYLFCSICSQRRHTYKLIIGVPPFSNDSTSLNLPQAEAALSKGWGPEEGNVCGWFRNDSELLGDTLLPPPCHALVGSWGVLEFSRQEYWSGLPFPSPGDLPDLRMEPRSSALQAKSLPSEPPGKPLINKLTSNVKSGPMKVTCKWWGGSNFLTLSPQFSPHRF